VGEPTHSREFIMIMTHLCTRLKQRALLCSKRIIPLGGLFTLVSSLWLCLPAKAIDPARLHMKPFGHPASLNQILAPTLRSPVQQQQEEEEPLIELFATGPQWQPLGPSPIPNGQTFGPTEVPVSGRVSAIAVDPHDPNLVYVGGAQGGVYRSLDGGQNWTQLLVGAKNFAVGCITVDPVDPNIIFIGTGEGNLSADSYFGVGVYVVRNAKSGTPKLEGPFNLDETGTNVFTYRSIVSIAVDPNNDNIIFAASSSGVGGLGAKVGYPSTAVPLRGLYRSKNFLTGTHRFQRLNVGPGTNTIVTSAVLDPANPNHLVCAVFGQIAGTSTDQNPQGGIYYTDNALAANPTFIRTQQTLPNTADGNVPLFTNIKLAAADVNGKLTVLAATDEFDTNQLDQGLLRKSTDGGKTFPKILTAADGFAGGQGFYNIAIAIDQKNPQNVYLAGTVSATGVDPDGPPGYGYMYIDGQVVPNTKPSNPTASGHGPANGGGTFQYSTDGGQTFTPSVSGLHADSHAIAIAPSATNVIYTGNDGGIWASADSGKEWRDCNTKGFSATQFESVAVHPTDPNFTLGGTQDNGTILRIPDGSFYRADFGDGGYALIDQSAANTENVTMYHTYFNQTGGLIGFGRTLSAGCAQEGQWSFMGIYGGPVDPTVHCDGTTDTFNGIKITDNVNFYAPIALGPGTPNTVYFGTDTLYRSSNKGTTMPAVSQAPIESGHVPISAIGISPTSDNIRVVGLDDGTVWATTTGASTLKEIDGGMLPLDYVCRVVLDPIDPNTAYVTFNGYFLTTGPGLQIWVTHNLSAATPTWTAAGKGIPSISVNGFVVDPTNTSHLFAGTDHGVYASTDAGATWHRFGKGFPNVEIFDLQLQSPARILRAATHGLGIWQASIFGF
jgi:photosystem II stability/assembly factor-like uncharacterized protein